MITKPTVLQPQTAGFTLIEMMVAVSIFVVVALIATGAFITANQVNQKAQAIKLVMDNLNFALDSMVLKMRQGGYFHCLQFSDLGGVVWSPAYETGLDCGSISGTAIAFKTPKSSVSPDKVVYTLDRSSGRGVIKLWESGSFNTGNQLVEITSPEIDIDYLKFDVQNTSLVPRVVVVVHGTVQVAGQTSSFGLETTVSERQ